MCFQFTFRPPTVYTIVLLYCDFMVDETAVITILYMLLTRLILSERRIIYTQFYWMCLNALECWPKCESFAIWFDCLVFEQICVRVCLLTYRLVHSVSRQHIRWFDFQLLPFSRLLLVYWYHFHPHEIQYDSMEYAALF